MAKKFKKTHIIYICVICALLLIIGTPIYKHIRTEESTALLPQNTNGVIFSPMYEKMPFCWGVEAPLSKAIDFSSSTNYWICDKNPNIALSVSVSKNSKYIFFYDEQLLKKTSYKLPEVSAENVSEIVLARESYNYSLRYTDNNQLYWNSIECIPINLTEAEKIQLAELIFHDSPAVEVDYTTEFPESGEPYLLHFRVYFNNCEGIYYEPGTCLYRTSDDQYFLYLSYLEPRYVFLPDEINQKFQSIFENNDFGFNTGIV